MSLVAIDVGGTFTDCVLVTSEGVKQLKMLSGGPLVVVSAVRTLLGVLEGPLPPCEVRLGTTRGTNALLTRTGARTALVTTRGFGDLPLIGNQDRPRLFDLAIHKREPLCEQIVEVSERVAVDGEVLEAVVPSEVSAVLNGLRASGITSLAVSLLHGFEHSSHEALIGEMAKGFDNVSLGSEVAPFEKIVPRTETTILDAYLNPVLRDYIGAIRAGLGPNVVVRAMTSAGGLVDAAQFRGRDCILSGPAGGAVGYAAVARGAGFGRAIGFDMGGTSTDVSRWDGRHELVFEGEKAGVWVVAPMVAIETVAAGGGSICGFDGIKLVVGPASAGSDPGPACYGRGGPLTVTDLNLVLGRIRADQFPFSLDFGAARERLEALCDTIAASPIGLRYAPEALAEGFLEVANLNMVRAIRAVSVSRGYDPADHVLVTFGGAGGQHACAVARELGIRQVLSHPLSGVLSAHGIGLAAIQRVVSRSLRLEYSDEALREVEVLAAELEASGRAALSPEGVVNVVDSLSLDIRYKGTESALTIAEPESALVSGNPGSVSYREAFEAAHKRHYGYVHADRPLEIVALRVTVESRSQDGPGPSAGPAIPRSPATAFGTAQVWFGGRKVEAEVFRREDLAPGVTLEGPAILCESTSTLVLNPGWIGRILPGGEVLLEDTSGPCRYFDENSSGGNESEGSNPGDGAGGRLDTIADPIRLEIFNNHFAAIAEQMGIVLQKTATSTNVKERLDFSCALFTRSGDLVVNAPHIPVHLGAMGETIKAILREAGPLSQGDVVLSNDPYRGGSHLPDITVVSPGFLDGALAFFVASRAHHADVGGIVPGSMPPFSKTLAEEGVVLRNLKLVDRGQSRAAAVRAQLLQGPYPARDPDAVLADLAAQTAANLAGLAAFEALALRASWPVVEAYMRHVQDAAASKTRQALRALESGMPDGRPVQVGGKAPTGTSFSFTDHLDDGSPIAVAITVSDGKAIVDFAGTGPVLAGNLNANRAIVTAAVLYAFRCLLAEDIPLNQGVLDPLEIRIPPGSLLLPPDRVDPAECPAMVGGNVETSQRIVDVLLGALGLAAASQGTMNNLAFGDATFGYYETICGGSGATPGNPGADAVHTHMTNTRMTDPEVLERRYPVRVLRFAIREGSGGGGQWRGGDGAVREIEFLKPLSVSILSERRGSYAPFGLEGGLAGELGRNRLFQAASNSVVVLDGKAAFTVLPGDRLIIETPGGGGWGSPD